MAKVNPEMRPIKLHLKNLRTLVFLKRKMPILHNCQVVKTKNRNCQSDCLETGYYLFDEPTSALDPELVGTVVQDMDHLAQQGQTMIVVTHLMSFAKKVATKVLFFADGAILESGTPDQIFNHPKEKRTKEFLSAIAEDR